MHYLEEYAAEEHERVGFRRALEDLCGMNM